MDPDKGNKAFIVNPEFAAYLPSKLLELIDREIEKPGQSDVLVFALKYQREALLSKYVSDDTDPPELRRHRAIVKWLGVERRNARTNQRLFKESPTMWPSVTMTDILLKAGEIVSGVIGSEPPLRLNGRFTGGATTSRKRTVGVRVSKYVGRLDATPSAVPYFLAEVGDSIWAQDEEVLKPRLVKGNVLFTVPKKTDIDRVACKEPDVNVFLQRAVGIYIRNKMRDRCNVNLRDQSVNRELARTASRDGSLATIDLSSASDSLTYAMVTWLMPPKWLALLDDLRCHKTFIDGKSTRVEMFSSMGNGFTFEVESLVFYALARATAYLSGVKGKISVYGDDLIVPTAIFRRFLNVLRFCGFTPNVDKTFGTGHFRESCGGHYFRGHDVTPFYLRAPIKHTTDLILFLNQLRSWILRLGLDVELDSFTFCTTPFTRLWDEGSTAVKRSLHGGHDPASRYQLVSLGKPRTKLVQSVRVHEGAQARLAMGAYLSRLHEYESAPEPSQAWERELDIAVPGNPFGVHTPKWSLVRVRDYSWIFGLTKPLFITEQVEQGYVR